MHGRSPLPKARSPNPFEPDDAADWRPQIAWLAAEGRPRRWPRCVVISRGSRRLLSTALLPLALVEPYFRALQNPRHEPARDIVEIAPIARCGVLHARIGQVASDGQSEEGR